MSVTQNILVLKHILEHFSDSHDALMNFGSHSKFAHQWIDKLNIEAEAKKVAAEPIGEAKNLQVPVITD